MLFLCFIFYIFACKNHWFSYDEKMSVESVTQAVSDLALAFSDQEEELYAMVTNFVSSLYQTDLNFNKYSNMISISLE